MRPQLFHGEVRHARLRPLRNAFRYRVFFLRFALQLRVVSETIWMPNFDLLTPCTLYIFL